MAFTGRARLRRQAREKKASRRVGLELLKRIIRADGRIEDSALIRPFNPGYLKKMINEVSALIRAF